MSALVRNGLLLSVRQPKVFRVPCRHASFDGITVESVKSEFVHYEGGSVKQVQLDFFV
jgi:predicted RNase H-like nuclease